MKYRNPVLSAILLLSALFTSSTAQARWYAPDTGLFASQAPLPPSSEHPYNYTDNNPVNRVDLKGREYQPWWYPGHGNIGATGWWPDGKQIEVCVLGETGPNAPFGPHRIIIDISPANSSPGVGVNDGPMDIDHVCVGDEAYKFRTLDPQIECSPTGSCVLRGGKREPSADPFCERCPSGCYEPLTHR